MVLLSSNVNVAFFMGRAISPKLRSEADRLNSRLYELEDVIYAYNVTFRMQYHAIPVRLEDKLLNLAGHVLRGEARPTQAQEELFVDHKATYQSVLDGLDDFIKKDFAAFNSSRNR
ncbi:MAG: hypothetical protein IH898_08210 [Planctomycetes bacterium]|nr:hypothetical protein [Planctomycetota bacterium]